MIEFPFSLRDLSTLVAFEQSTSASSHPWSIYRLLVHLQPQSWPQSSNSSLWLVVSNIYGEVVSLYMSSLTSHYYLQVVLLMSLLCHAFVQRKLSPKSVFVYTSWPSYESKLSYKCQYDLCPKTYQFILVRRLCWMMWDASMPSFW